ncbi:MAG: T9SS type A sorting domain-containing protein, partial [Flavobacteriales bacterium]|nr:T9SS type A sorting domain-containing protein [Flavobacteriales bacterium]
QESPGIFTIISDHKVLSVEVFSMEGASVVSDTGNVNRFDLSKEAGGIYVAKVKTEQGDLIQKVVVRN